MESTPSEEQQVSMDNELYWETKISQEFFNFLKLERNSEEEDEDGNEEEGEEEDEDGNEEEGEEEEEEEEFSFAFGGESESSSIAAEDAFSDGRIKAVFPLFKRDLLFHGGDSDSDSLPENLPMNPPVKKVFVETEEGNAEMTSSAPESDAIEGPYCEWSSRKAVEVSSSTDVKKSNSTGFSKIWRFKEFRERCNSDGRDAFVFLHRSHAPPKPKTEETVKVAGKAKKSGNKKKVSAHELYLMSKTKDDRRRTYLPYRPELMGFFTNVSSGGLTRNVHPY